MAENKTILSLQAHPDDAEFSCAGALALLHAEGWQVHIASMTPGDCGTAELGRKEISLIRRNEAMKSVKLLEGAFHCLEFDDLFVAYSRPSLLKAIELIRKVRPAIVFAPSPSDYMVDHEVTSRIVQTACFASGIKNIETAGTEPFEPVPHLYYVDPMEGKDNFGGPLKPGMYVDIGGVIETKKKMLSCHESQRHWLLVHHCMDEYVLSMERYARQRGGEIGIGHAEGFRQHLGHGFPQDNILKSALGNLVWEIQLLTDG